MWKRHASVWLFLAALHLSQSIEVYPDAPRVEIKNGTLEGLTMRSRSGMQFAAFRGIPYAKPPLGDLRFEPPAEASAWRGVRPAKDDAGICTQRNVYTHQEEVVGSEDCLYLNVYTPRVPKDPLNDIRFPVMIWFHGGGWLTGAGHSDFYGPKFLLDHDVVLVTVNFRLGPLGFLSTEDMACPGNQGMKDQAQSIRWVHENIAAFGGDPNRVTLFGESAGGASVTYHMISPLSKGLFHRGISQSGNVFCPWTLTRPGDARTKAKSVAQQLNCPTADTKDLIECLRTKNAKDIIGTDWFFQVFDYCPMIPFRPVIEPDHQGAFITEDPALLMKHGLLADIPWMTGITSQEGSLRVPGLYTIGNGVLIKKLNKDFNKIAPVTLLFEDQCPNAHQKEMTKKIKKFYFGNRPIDNSTRFDLIDAYSDAWFNYAAHQSVRYYLETQSSPVYYYYFAYKGSASFSRIFGDPSQDYGVSHADDLQYLFPVGEQLFQDTPLNEQDRKMVDILTSLWFNFANSANPTPRKTKDVPVKWQPVRTCALEYLHIGSPSDIRMSANLLSERMQFWETLPVRPDLKSENAIPRRIKEEL